MSNLSQFAEAIRSRGVAKSSKFEVFFPIPIVLSEIGYTGDSVNFVHMMAEQAQMPEFALQTHRIEDDGIGRETIVGKSYPPVSLTFICDGKMEVKKFFDDWVLGTMKSPNGVFRYRDSYVVDRMEISQLNERGVATHKVFLYDAYPRIVDDVFFSAASRDYNRCRVQFVYRNWGIENVSGANNSSEIVSQ